MLSKLIYKVSMVNAKGIEEDQALFLFQKSARQFLEQNYDSYQKQGLTLLLGGAQLWLGTPKVTNNETNPKSHLTQ